MQNFELKIERLCDFLLDVRGLEPWTAGWEVRTSVLCHGIESWSSCSASKHPYPLSMAPRALSFQLIVVVLFFFVLFVVLACH